VRVSGPRDLGALVRDRRRRLGMTQDELARRVGVSRQWVVGLEQGKARAFGLVLRTLGVLGLNIDIFDDDASAPRGRVDLDSLLGRFDRDADESP
jgi:HTH-type transcriptional regulator / antitoxin HipB